MEIQEIINSNTKVLTVTKTLEGLVWPIALTKYKRAIYYIVFNNILVKVGQTSNFYERSAAYRTEAKKLNENLEPSNNGSPITIHKLNELMNIGQTAEIYAWFVESKKQYEVQDGRRVPLTVNMLGLETLERKRLNPLLK
tara:strand:+ start:117 stop:536 length:420 start_codon:yes stop_codon:yes gene_type:complete